MYDTQEIIRERMLSEWELSAVFSILRLSVYDDDDETEPLSGLVIDCELYIQGELCTLVCLSTQHKYNCLK